MTSTQTTSVRSSASRAPSLDQAANDPGRSLREGQHGQGVTDLQKLLEAAGEHVVADGKFGPKTDEAVRSFQQKNGLEVDGLAGMETIHKLREVAAAQGHSDNTVGAHRAPTEQERAQRPTGTTRASDLQNTDANARSFAPQAGRARSTFGNTQAAREQQAEALLRKNGVQIQAGKTYVVQIDQDPPKSRDSAFEHGYTGQTVVMRGTRDGHLSEAGGPFRTSSHPGQDNPVGSDGVPGTAFIRAGAYQYTTSTHVHHGKERFDPLSNMPAARDLNHDGAISDAERARTFTAGAIQWHPGNASGPSSTGCQNVDPSQFSAFKHAIQSGGNSTFTYLLVRRPNDRHGANPV